MNAIKRLIAVFTFLLTGALIFTSCDNDDDSPTGGTAVRLEITDAPIDDTNVQGAFVTITEVKIDGKTFAGFEGTQTIDLLSYQNGDTKILGTGELEAGAYSSITLVLDYEQDANGNSPGCYILTTDDVRESLEASAGATNEIVINSSDFIVEESGSTDVVIDFDLRKAIQVSDNSEDDYEFVTGAELRSALRVMTRGETGIIKGTAQNSYNFADKVVVYAYTEGSFDRDTEMSGQGSSNIQFQNAVTSAVVAEDGSYELHFLEEGSYEIHFAAYEDEDQDDDLELAGSLILDLAGNLDLNVVEVDAESSVTLNLLITGLLP